jgi:DDE superfamily endonuclease
MEDILEVYKRAYDSKRPQVCMDEVNTQLLKEVRDPIAPKPGKVRREDYEYQREGVCNVFLAVEPFSGKRFAQVRERRTRSDWALFMQELLDVHYATAEKVVLVLDTLNTHTPASFYEVFAPSEARRLAEKLEIHYTPKHGSWLNMAEIELSVLDRQVLDQRLSSLEHASREVEAWQERRNQEQAKISWRFTTQDARIKLLHLYPSLHH